MAKPSVEEVARECWDQMLELLPCSGRGCNVYMSGVKHHDRCPAYYQKAVIAWAIAFAARRVREELDAAAVLLSKQADDDQLTQRGYGKAHAADTLRRLASASDGREGERG